MGIYISGVKGLPEQVQQNKEDIKTIQEEIEGIDFEQIRQLEAQVGENTQDINNLEASIGVQNQAINTLNDDVDALESKTQKITYDEQSGELTIDANVNVKRINITASQTPLTADSMVSRDDKNAISLTGANDEISLIVGRTGTQHVLNFNADGTLDIDGQPIGGGATLYQHNISLNINSFKITTNIITNSATAMGRNELMDYLYNKGLTSASNVLLCSGCSGDMIASGLFASSLTTIYLYYGKIDGSAGASASFSISSIPVSDKVVQIV